MIVVDVKGGLGNQMFQWAYAKQLSIRNNIDIVIDLKSFVNYRHKFSLDKLNLEYNAFNNNIPNLLGIFDDYIFRHNSFDDNLNYYLDGYWQSEKYFSEISDIIRNDFSPNEIQLDKLNKTPLINTNSVSIHIRRTDYVSSNGYHPVQTIEYYTKALDIIGEYDYIFIFSDDIQWCKENLQFKNMIFMEGFDDIEDMWLMSLCKHNIIANSSFSWWGAWLNNNPNKKVIAPLNWFGTQANLNTSDIIPEGWIKI